MPEMNELEQAAIARDLVRKPAIKAVAYALAKINAPRGVRPDPNNIAPIYINLAYHILHKKDERNALLVLLETLA